MALTYATLSDFQAVKRIRKTADDPSEPGGNALIQQYLVRATRYIDRVTRRRFFPWRETRNFALPTRFFNMRTRYLFYGDIFLDADLLAVESLTSGPSGDVTTLTEGTDFVLKPDNVSPKFAILLVGNTSWESAASSGTYLSYRAPSIYVDGIWGYHERYSEAWIDSNVNMGSALSTTTATTFTIAAAATTDELGRTDVSAGELIRVEDEYLEVVSVAQDDETNPTLRTVTVRRGVQGTTAATHASGEDIYKFSVHDEIREACLMIVQAWRDHDKSEGGRLGVGEMSAGFEVGLPKDAQALLVAYQRSVIGQQV